MISGDVGRVARLDKPFGRAVLVPSLHDSLLSPVRSPLEREEETRRVVNSFIR